MAARQTVLLLLSAALVGVWETAHGQDCVAQITCGGCINTAGCAWCSQEDYNGIRCQFPENLTNCVAMENPQSSWIDQTRSTATDPPIDTEEVRLNLRVGSPQNFTIRVTPQRDLPLDLYILMDLSASMNEELDTIKQISSQIAARTGNITDNVRLGFGSFNDKIVQPYSYEPLDLSEPDTSGRYAFRHSVNLTNDTDLFAAQVNMQVLTANADLPENGLEALAQVITCEEIIGWRPRLNGVGTRVVLVMTDQEFHYAGEGRLAGILTPYNGTCLLEPNLEGGPVEFLKYADVDYPSVGQILELLRQYDVTTIFAIQEDHMRSYEYMAETILNSNNQQRSVVAGFNINSGQSANEQVLELIGNEYRRLLQSVSLDTSNVTTDATISIVPTCPDDPGVTREGDSCNQVPLETTVSFDVTITLNSCNGLADGQVIRHTVTSPSFGSFELVLNVTCNCNCASQGIRSAQCNQNGIRSCGVCECDPGICGSSCSVSIGNRTSLDCNRGGINNEMCSGRGLCDCTCICEMRPDTTELIFGDACQCDNFGCPRDQEDRICSGRGMCCEGRCMCDMSEAGNQYRHDPDSESNLELCQCEPLEEACMDPETNMLCNGNGVCGCNFCTCTDVAFTGSYCGIDNIGTCNFETDEFCLSLCRAEGTPPGPPSICDICNRRRPVIFVDMNDIAMFETDGNVLTLALENITNTRLGHGLGEFSFVRGQCDYTVEGCTTEYYILANETNFALVVIREEECVEAGFRLLVPIWTLAPIILGCLIILGLVLVLLIKVIFVILDYLEVKKWQKDAKAADWTKNPNPLYQSPDIQYSNVAYGQ